MHPYESLIKYLPLLESDKIGKWVVDRENDGSPEHPIQMPFVSYSQMVHSFMHDLRKFVDGAEDLGLGRYSSILEENGIEWNYESMRNADVSNLDARCVLALLVGAMRADRFSEGALLAFFKDGSIQKWLIRLKELGEGEI